MVGELMTLPLRVGVRAAQLWLRAAEQTVDLVTGATGRLIGSVSSSERPATPEPRYEVAEPPPAPRPPEPTTHEPPIPEPPMVEAAPEPEHVSAPELVSEEPQHVSEEPELVREVAEPGAQDGAGASVHVEPPWEGYDQMTAADVADRVNGANAAVLAAINLYETGTKGRKTVLEAVERELQASTGNSSQS